MLAVVPNPQRRKSVVIARCLMHGSQHACEKLVNTITFLDEWYKSRNTTLIINSRPEVGEHKLLECLNLILESY